MNEIILELLKQRGISSEDEINEFISLKPKCTYDPFLLSGMREGVDLILKTINSHKKICIYGDYDADGMTSVSILMMFLKNITQNIIYYVPSRVEEGYGLNKEAIGKIVTEDVNLIISVDCGITAIEEVEYAKKLGMDIIITDHHSVGECLPDCIVINPKKEECEYPNKNLAGCGVAFKLIQALQRKLKLDKKLVTDLLDIVALGTVGDIVSLTGENRTFVKYGLYKMNSCRRPIFESLSRELINGSIRIKSENISYGFIPHLNAAGRISDAKIGVESIMADSKSADKYSKILLDLNRKRKNIQEEIYQEAINEYESNHREDKFPLILMNEANEGVTGIVAGKLKDYCNKPVAILTSSEEGILKATCRSIENIDIYEVLKEFEYMFEKFGGHKGACGFSLASERYLELQKSINEYMKRYPDYIFEKEIKYDLMLSGKDLSLELAEELEILEPFGYDNEKPVFKLVNCYIRDIKHMGNEGQHLRIQVDVDEYRDLKCIMFNVGSEQMVKIKQNNGYIDIVGELEINEFRGIKSLQFKISEIV